MIRVTITGADDMVEPSTLAALSLDFPFVEWGILCSYRRLGTPRYPSLAWIDRLPKPELALAAHLCGEWARDLGRGFPSAIPVGVRRIQLNGFEHSWLSGVQHAAAHLAGVQFILQCRAEADLVQAVQDAEALPWASVLFDPSGGRGLEPFRWPRTPVGARLGFAGGIKPETVETVIGQIFADGDFLRDDFWIDLESGARDAEDHFSVSRVREVLERVAKINGRMASSEVR